LARRKKQQKMKKNKKNEISKTDFQLIIGYTVYCATILTLDCFDILKPLNGIILVSIGLFWWMVIYFLKSQTKVEIKKPEPTLAESVKVLQRHLEFDKDYKGCWVDNIAVNIQETFREEVKKDRAVYDKLYELSNKSAERFIDLLIYQNNKNDNP